MQKQRNLNNKKYRRWKKLRELYPSCQFDKENNYEKYKDKDIVYGEMNYNGMNKLHKYVKKMNPKLNIFMDIGSGRGKLCFYMEPMMKKCIGLEIVKERYDHSLQLKKQLKSKNVKLYNEDFLHKDIKYGKRDKVFCWISNLCFSEDLTNNIYLKLIQTLPKGSIVCSSKIPSEIENFTKLQVPMSWSTNSYVNIYTIK